MTKNITKAAAEKYLRMRFASIGYQQASKAYVRSIGGSWGVGIVPNLAVRHKRILMACDVGITSTRHRRIIDIVTNNMYFPGPHGTKLSFYTYPLDFALLVSLSRQCRDEEDVRGFDLRGLQSCWFLAEREGEAFAQIALLVDFIARKAMPDVQACASDERICSLYAIGAVGGPSNLPVAIAHFCHGDRALARRILSLTEPGMRALSNLDFYPEILRRLERCLNSGELDRILMSRV